jgi:hypothetical protein
MTEQNLLDEKGFVFIDDLNRPYWVAMWCDKAMIFYWHEAQKSWVTLREATQIDVWEMEQKKISEEYAEIYHKQHRKFAEG